MESSSYYDHLGLPADASQEEIRHAYRQLVLQLHPDKNVHKGETELFIDIQRAYECLSDPLKKSEYDSHLPHIREYDSPLSINTFFSQSTITRLAEPQLVYSLVELVLHPDTGLLISTSPLNISLVVDCSTSMQGVRLDTVKLTAIELLRQLHPNDIFSLVKFNDRAELLLPPDSLSDSKSAEMKVQLLQAGGGTEIYKGLEMAFSQVKRNHSTARVNHIILITDGRTYGDEGNCEILANQASVSGVGISALGIGNKWNDTFLDRITSITGGICKYISDNSEIRHTLLDEISRLVSSLTEKITYKYSAKQNIELRSAFRLHPDAAPLPVDSPLTLGFLPKQGSLSILLEFLLKDVDASEDNISLANGFLNYHIPRHPIKTQYVQRLDLSRQITQFSTNEAPPQAILNAISLFSLYRMQERARDEVRRGDINSGTRHLKILATHLLNKGEDQLAQSVLNEVTYMQHNQSFSEDGEKRIKYGTRSLLLPARTEER